jgi:pyruvate,water dikinase
VAEAADPIDALWLDDVGLDQLPRVGGKLARLGALRARGGRVPNGFVLPVAAFDAFIAPVRTDLEGALHEAPADYQASERLAAAARSIVEQQPYPLQIEDVIRRAYDELSRRAGRGTDPSTAVRSSGICEDGDTASFAGQFDSFLGVRSADAVLEHVRRCWASQYTTRSLEYRRQRGLPLTAQGIAVGVMELVAARSAGVTFTLNPITGDTGQAVVEANWGFGESVVSGVVIPDHFLVSKADGAILEQRIATKERWSVFDEDARCVVDRAAPADQARRPCLSPTEVQLLVQLAVEIEAREGRPQDVEWAIDAALPFPDNVFVLQHRPETAWSNRPAPPVEEAHYDPIAYALRNVFKVSRGS